MGQQPAEHEFRTTFVREPNSLRHNPALVLNADYRPLSYYPLSLWTWQEAVKAAGAVLDQEEQDGGKGQSKSDQM